MDDVGSTPPTDWLESLDRSKAQIEAGEVVPMEPFVERLKASISRMEARRQQKKRSVRRA